MLQDSVQNTNVTDHQVKPLVKYAYNCHNTYYTWLNDKRIYIMLSYRYVYIVYYIIEGI